MILRSFLLIMIGGALPLRALTTASFSLHSGSFVRRASLKQRHSRRSMVTRSTITMMPEGPEVRTLVDQLQGGVGMRLLDISFVSGRYVRHEKPAGFEEFSKTMTPYNSGKNNVTTDVIQAWKAKGKFIYILLDDGAAGKPHADFQRSIWITLGMSGRFINEDSQSKEGGHRYVRWYLSLQDPRTLKAHKIFYQDMRNFGTLKFCLSAEALEKKLSTLGPDILDSSMSQDDFVQIVEKQKPELNVCKFLMNQSKLCGVGNYILAEGLYRAGIDPFASLNEIEVDQQRRLFHELQATAQESYGAQGLSRPSGSYRDVDGNRGKFEFALQCYGRQRCAQRDKPVIREREGPHGRTIWYTEDQLFMPRILRYGSVPVTDQSKGQLDDVDTPVACDYMQDAASSNESSVDVNDDEQGHNVQSDSKARLLAGLTDKGWKEALSDEISSPTFESLAEFLSQERLNGATIFPPEDEIFSAFNMCPFDKVNVVIVGQDPYHGRGQGHGLAFSVRKGVPPPPSLKNIFKEAMADVQIAQPHHGYLESWAQQGVLLLNAVLTVREGEANSHARQGWEEFTDCIIDTLNTQKEGLVFLLWGNPAAKKASGVDAQRHMILKTSHPSPLGATKTKTPFLGSRCFSRANAALESYGKSPIDWNVK